MPPPAPQTVLLVGSTGTAGRATALALQQAGHAVVAFGRNDPKITDVQFRQGDVCAPQDVHAIIDAVRPDTVVSCLASRTGAPKDAWRIDHDAHLTLLGAAQSAGVTHFILLSAICVQKPRLAFQHAKLAFEGTLRASGMPCTIVRPTALFKSLSGQLARVQAGKPYLMFGDGALTACKPISDRDLGQFITNCLTDTPTSRNAVLPIGGPGSALTPKQMGEALFRLTGKPPKFRRVPMALLKTIAVGLRLGGTFSATSKAKSELARIGLYYASESMLVWDAANARYDANATPEFGSDTLFDYYADLIAGKERLERGDHAVF